MQPWLRMAKQGRHPARRRFPSHSGTTSSRIAVPPTAATALRRRTYLAIPPALPRVVGSPPFSNVGAGSTLTLLRRWRRRWWRWRAWQGVAKDVIYTGEGGRDGRSIQSTHHSTK